MRNNRKSAQEQATREIRPRDTTKTATMKDIAELTGVSIATVSRVLSKPEKVAAATRQKVEQALLDLKYCSYRARYTKNIESKSILVMVPDLSNIAYAENIRGIQAAASEQGYLVLICDGSTQKLRQVNILNLIMTQKTDGVILLGSQMPFDTSIEGQKRMPPMVMVNEFLPELKLPTVHIDHLTASFDVVNHLWQLGNRRIACIAGPKGTPLCHSRLQGYTQALRRNGLSVDPQYVVYSKHTLYAGSAALRQLMSLPEPPDALFCHSDILALGAMAQAKRMGIRVPNDLSFAGFGDIEFSRYSDPSLTTVSQPSFNIGFESIQLLLEQIRKKSISKPHSRLFDFELKVRASTV